MITMLFSNTRQDIELERMMTAVPGFGRRGHGRVNSSIPLKIATAATVHTTTEKRNADCPNARA